MKTVRNLIIIIILGICLPVVAQESAELKPIEDMLVSVRINRGDVLYPEEFFRLKQLFDELKENSEGRPLTTAEIETARDILKSLREMDRKAEAARPYVSSLLAARDEALLNGANDLAPEDFENAEQQLQNLAEKFEEMSPQKIEGVTSQILRSYRKAHFQTIRNRLLGEVKILVEESRDLDAEKYTPQTLLLVEELLDDIEVILNRKQFDDPTLQEKAALLASESQHLLFLAQLSRKIHREDAAFESYLLQLEDFVKSLALAVDYNPDFYEGIAPVLENIRLSVEELQSEQQDLMEENRQLRDSLTFLNQQLRESRDRVRKEESLSDKIKQVEGKLKPFGILVFKYDTMLVLRYNGLQFNPGNITVSNNYAESLSKIGEALQILPYASILVRLKQSGGGNSEYNQTLADQRAKSVAYLIQTAGYIPDETIRAEGIVLRTYNANSHSVVDVVVELKR